MDDEIGDDEEEEKEEGLNVLPLTKQNKSYGYEFAKSSGNTLSTHESSSPLVRRLSITPMESIHEEKANNEEDIATYFKLENCGSEGEDADNISCENGSEEEKNEKGNEEEGEDEEEEEEDNNFIELYFQPKFQKTGQNSFKVENILEVLVPFIDEKIYDDLRTQ